MYLRAEDLLVLFIEVIPLSPIIEASSPRIDSVKRKTWVTFDHQFTFAAPKRRGRWLFLALLFPLTGGVLAYALTQQVTPRAPEPTTVSSAMQPPAAALEEPSGSEVNVVVRPNDTIEAIFRHLKLSAADLKTVLDLPGVGHSFKQLKVGDKMTVVHNGAVLQGINRHISETEVLSVTRNVSGFAAERIITMN